MPNDFVVAFITSNTAAASLPSAVSRDPANATIRGRVELRQPPADLAPRPRVGDVAMPLTEAYAYDGTPRGAGPTYVNAFAVQSRAYTLPYDAMSAAAGITVPAVMVHSEHALTPDLARHFGDAFAEGCMKLLWNVD